MQPYLDLQAQAIMQLATSPVQFPQDDPLNKNAAVWASPCNVPIDKDVLFPIDTTILHVAQTGSNWVERLLDFATLMCKRITFRQCPLHNFLELLQGMLYLI